MNITGVEVIRRNPGVDVGVITGEKVELTYGDTLRVNVSFDYRGLAMKTTLEGAIGKLHAFPTEWLEVLLKSGTTIDIPESFEFTPYERSVEIPITSDIDPGTDYDLSVSLLDYREAGHPTIVDIIDIVGVPPDYVLIQETIYPMAYIYEGWQETCVFEFPLGPEQLPFTQWGGLKIAEAMASHVEGEGSRVLELRVYEDTTPPLWTNYRVEVTAAITPQEGIAIWPVLAALPWVAIIKGTLIVLGIVIVGWVIEKLIKAIDKAFFHTTPGLEDVKPTWSRETLIGTINDSEEYWKRPPTPLETLEGMSEEELRVHLDQIAEEEVPPPPPEMTALVALALLGVGVGGAVVLGYLLTKPE